MLSNRYSELLIRLKTCRILSGFKSARAFTTAFSLSSKTYTQYESGQRKISLENLIEYSKCLRIDPYWLMSGEGFPSQSDELNNNIYEYLNTNYNISTILPKLYSDKKSQLDGQLLTSILSKLFDLVSKNNIETDCYDLVEFAYSIYNSIIDSTVDQQTKDKLVDLATNSLLTAKHAIRKESKKINFPENK